MNTDIGSRIRDAVARISSLRIDDEMARLSLASSYPSGSLVTVELSAHKSGKWFVSDGGMGHFEASMLGVGDIYSRTAKVIADDRGLRFDGQNIFVVEIEDFQLEAGIIAIGDASRTAAERAIERGATIANKFLNDELRHRLVQIFGKSNVAFEVEIDGAHSSWRVDNYVQIHGTKAAIYEAVTNHQNSISSKYLMFSDLHRTSSYSLNSIVETRKNLSDKAVLLADVSRVIEINSADDRYKIEA